MSSLLFADDFVGIAEAGLALQSWYINIVNIGDLKSVRSNVPLQFFQKLGKVSGKWVWGDESLPVSNSYCHLGVEFSSDGSWDKHTCIKLLIVRDRENFGSLY